MTAKSKLQLLLASLALFTALHQITAAPQAAQSFAPVAAAQFAPLFKNLPTATRSATPLNMEALNQSHGCLLYRVTLPKGPATTLTAKAIADFGFVFLDGQRIGIMDRRHAHSTVDIPARDKESTLDILVEAVGHINFGQEMRDRKGLAGPVILAPRVDGGGNATEISDWQIYSLPLDSAQLSGLRYESSGTHRVNEPAFWRATVTLPSQADTWLDMGNWGKGVVWINGRCLGRYWNIGPTQTMYVPGPWLRRGENEIVILDLLGPTNPKISGTTTPVLDQLRPVLDFARGLRRKYAPDLDTTKSAWSGAFPRGASPCEIRFKSPVRVRYFCLESIDAHDGKPYAAIAELNLLTKKGDDMPIVGWVVVYADSEESLHEDGAADNALDGQTASHWHTEWSDEHPEHPHCLIIDLGKTREIAGFRYVPRQGGDEVGGRIKNCRVYVGDSLVRKQ